MAANLKRRARDPEATRSDILEAALVLLAQDGPEAVSLSAVAVKAGVNRGTAYQHFETREKLVEEALQLVSDRMFEAVFGTLDLAPDRDIEKVDMVEVTERISSFAMENSDLCRIWLMQMLNMPDPSQDRFWREYVGSLERFSKTDMAQPGIDVEPFAITNLAGTFFWPIWARSHSHSEEERAALADRYALEIMRFSLYGSVKKERLPNVVRIVKKGDLRSRRLRAAPDD